jgi:GH24 family phage-related lysozyme (muramidase)
MKIIALAVATVTIAGIYVAHNVETIEWTTEVTPLIEEKETPKIDFELNLDVPPDNIDIPDPLDTPLLVLPPVIVYPKDEALLSFNFSRVIPKIQRMPDLPEIDWQRYMLDGVMYFEGYYKQRYYCAGGQATIGYGCTNPRIVSKGYVSRSYAKEVLSKELETARAQVLRVVSVDLNSHQLHALTSFTFNCGLSNLKRLVEQPGRLNDGNYKSVEVILPKYRKAGGNIRKGLERRRMWELKLWRGEKDSNLF